MNLFGELQPSVPIMFVGREIVETEGEGMEHESRDQSSDANVKQGVTLKILVAFIKFYSERVFCSISCLYCRTRSIFLVYCTVIGVEVKEISAQCGKMKKNPGNRRSANSAGGRTRQHSADNGSYQNLGRIIRRIRLRKMLTL